MRVFEGGSAQFGKIGGVRTHPGTRTIIADSQSIGKPILNFISAWGGNGVGHESVIAPHAFDFGLRNELRLEKSRTKGGKGRVGPVTHDASAALAQ